MTHAILKVRVVTAAAASLLGASLVGANLAQADAPDPSPASPAQENATAAMETPHGTVISRSGVNIRQHPTRNSRVVGFLRHHQRVSLACKTRSQNVGGNRIWYKLRGYNHNWVSARYVKSDSSPRQCKVTHEQQEATHDSVAPKG